MKDYTSFGYNSQLKKQSSLPANAPPYRSVLEWDVQDERSSFIPGNVSYPGGTLVEVFIGTALMVGGTIRKATIGTPAITNGTALNTVLNNNTVGTPGITGGTATSTVLNANTIGSPTITGGTYNTGTFAGTPVITNPLITNGTANAFTLGSPTIVNGTANNITLGTPAITGGTATSFTFSNKITVATGANQSIGKGTLASGVATISTTSVTASSNIFVTPIASGLNLGILAIGTINAGTDFVVTSSNALDSDSFNWWIIN